MTENMNDTINRIDWTKVENLIPVIVQDTYTAQVLMLGYMNADALNVTIDTGNITFYSRTKERLWTKGETSGNYLKLQSMALDCDNDTLLMQATPMGETCHTGTKTCFDGDNAEPPKMTWIALLEQLLGERKNVDADSSYTASLYQRGTKRIAQKVGEEGVEVALAAVANDNDELINESADLLYHLLVLLQQQGLSLEEVVRKLQERHQ